jgi:hypothetical protein
MEAEIKAYIIARKIESLRACVNYYKNGFYPELEGCTGSSQAQHLERAENKLKAFLVDVNDYKHHQKFEVLPITDTEKLNYIRLFAIEKREQATDYDNIWIKMRSLRLCVKALQLLKSIEPKLEIYSNHWLSLRTKINIG